MKNRELYNVTLNDKPINENNTRRLLNTLSDECGLALDLSVNVVKRDTFVESGVKYSHIVYKNAEL